MSVNLGGVNPMYYAMIESSQYDSWLTIGIDSGNIGELSSTGLDFSTWNEHSRLVSDPVAGGSVFWLDPQSAPNRADTDGTGLGQVQGSLPSSGGNRQEHNDTLLGGNLSATVCVSHLCGGRSCAQPGGDKCSNIWRSC